ncbi:MAG: protoporphyrinogen oxidase HemJ [Gammaproteobacteria bacterium]|nr:protoporphyrinogen oxidase HemJ [Gammaproteobacteria bacterium]NNC97058.1 protoporphyrinogen oxidase HemJ [Gammaproteobacteria bacterium]NNM14346.1 protoporphyrinogen oxidase HemJ [Gammaproteobacteria bacterium]
MPYLYIKALHIIFMVTWFAGLFYLPRLFIYHTESNDDLSHQRFIVMERKLFIIMSIGMLLTVVFGFWLLGQNPALMKSGWLHAKLAFVAGLIIYHFYCHKIQRDLRDGIKKRSSKWLRYFNEGPAVLLIIIVILAVAKPF